MSETHEPNGASGPMAGDTELQPDDRIQPAPQAATLPEGVSAPTAAAAAGNGARELSADSKAKIAHIRSRYPEGTKAALIPALHIAQEEWGGWLPTEAVEAVSRELGIPAAEVWGVVSFYDLFHEKPVGRHRIRVCTNLPCQLRGSGEIMETLAEELRVGEDQVTPDGRCSYVHFECLGSCDTAPMMMLDDTYHENLTPERVREILKELD